MLTLLGFLVGSRAPHRTFDLMRLERAVPGRRLLLRVQRTCRASGDTSEFDPNRPLGRLIFRYIIRGQVYIHRA
jgi:hypothetical protein